mmetsp:Transcript_12663/g.12757  ORF Transcript_12663/g.12757 Transcript_12663/m.12757 type:complete len:425 (-) Transcript_12663:13-1287(-)
MLYFPCPKCSNQCYDGGLCKKVVCRCGKIIMRNENDAISEIPTLTSSGFQDVFSICNNTLPPNTRFPELQSITLGIFRENLPLTLLSGGRVNFKSIFIQFLAPYFSSRLRCLGVGDYFKCENVKFKVLGCRCNFGLITQNTVINCYDILTENQVQKVQILPIYPSQINPMIFSTVFRDYFNSGQKHLHMSQYLYLNRMEYVITASEPMNGLVGRESQFFFEGEPLIHLQSVSFSCFIEDLPIQYHRMARNAIIYELVNCYVIPYFQGMKRLVCQGQVLSINGLDFIISSCFPQKGLIMDDTHIMFDCSLRARNPNLAYVLESSRVWLNSGLIDMDVALAELEQSIETINSHRVRAAPRDLVETFPIREIRQNEEGLDKCTVCYCEYEPGDKIKTLPCSHFYHDFCIDQWLNRSNVCPLCKYKIE